MIKKALILGASGLVGTALTRLLMDDLTYDEIHILVRKPTNKVHKKLVEHVIDFDRLALYSHLFQVEHVFCCLGTTIKKAKTKTAFYRVDHDYVLESAKLASTQKSTFSVISSMGANPHSIFYYSRVKGEMEQSLQTIPLPSLFIFRPSLLLGDRSEYRFGEKLASPLSKILLRGPLKRYKPNHAETVARAMISCANQSIQGIHIFESSGIEKLGA